MSLSSQSLPADADARTLALDPTQSFAVTAPAGSGKTGLLAQRVLKLLALCEYPEEVLCITFTRKAAAEMQERIVHALQLANSQARPATPHEQLSWDLAKKVLDRDTAKNWQLLKSPNRLRTQTIDGLCRSLTQQNPISSGMGGNAQLLDQPVFAYRKAAENTLKQLETSDESSAQLRHDLGILLTHLDNNMNSVSALLVALLAKRDQWLMPLMQAQGFSRDLETRQATRQYLEAAIDELNHETLTDITQRLQPFASDLCLMADYAGTNCIADQPKSLLCKLSGITELPTIDSEQLELWRALVELILNNSGEWRSPRGLNKRFGFPAGDKETKSLCQGRKAQMAELLGQLSQIPKLKDLLHVVRGLPPANYSAQQWRLLDSLTRTLPLAAAELMLVFRQLNACDFTEVTQGALLALGSDDNPSELALVMDYQIKHILVDEFQDTSSPQLQLLQKLTAGWQQDDGRTLFIVGDGMQSCYGFRDANVGIFLDAREHGIGDIALTPLDLTVNFRSQAGVVNWVNDTFLTAFPDADDIARGAVSYSSSIAYKAYSGEDAVSFHGIVDADNRLDEASQIRDIVQRTLQEKPDGRIAILVRSRPHLSQIIPTLQAAGIRWQATDIDPLASRMAIVDLLTLTRALHDPSDRNAWLALLRTPWCGLDMQDLHTIASLQLNDSGEKAHFPHLLLRLQDHKQILGLSTAGKLLLDRFVPIINTAWKNRRRKPLAYWIKGTWIALGGPTCLTDSADYANTEDYFQLLEQYDHGGHISDWQEFNRAMQQLYAKPATDADPRVQVMTIHKSKGLEFETVIIPGLDKGSRADDHQLLLWQERINHSGDKRLLLSPLSATGTNVDPLYQFLRDEQKIKGQLESTRLLYVGCTRAIEKLHLLANIGSDNKTDGYKAPTKGSLLTNLWHQVKDSVIPCFATHNKDDEGVIQELNFIRRLPSHWQRPALVPSSLLAAYRGREFDDEDNLASDERFQNRSARHTGSLLHRALEQVVQDGIGVWSPERITRQRPVWEIQLRQQGLTGETLITALNKIELGLRHTLEDPIGHWILDGDHTDSQCELSLWSQQSSKGMSMNSARESIIDRTYVASAPEELTAHIKATNSDHQKLDAIGDEPIRWIIDYKSSEPAAGQTEAVFIEEEVRTYQGQLERYQKLFTDEPELCKASKIAAALYFPMIKRLEIITFNEIP